jgi:hypothetical protein
MTNTISKRGMTDAHKAALAVGRSESKAVRDYLEGLRASKPARGRKRTSDTVTSRLAAIDTEISSASPMAALRLNQERLDLQAELASMGTSIDLGALETAFVAVAKSYSERTGVSYSAFRAVGVSPAVLKAAGLKS